jgi:hypothetical protein
LKGSLGQATPSHPPHPITAFPRAKDFFDPAAHASHAIILASQLLQRAVAFTSQYASLNDMRKPSFGLHRGGKGTAPVGAVCVDGSRIIRQRTMARATVMNIAGRDG